MEESPPRGRGSYRGRSTGRNSSSWRGRGRYHKPWRKNPDNDDASDTTSRRSDSSSPIRKPYPQPEALHPVQEPPSLREKPSDDDKDQEESVTSDQTPTNAVLSHNDKQGNAAFKPRRQYTPNGWNVKVVCKKFEWHLHKNVLRKCHYFSAFLPVSKSDNESMSVIELHNHCPEQLGSVFQFMYFFGYPGAKYDRQQPLYGDSLLTNTSMFIAGASVDHRGMMQYAKKQITAWCDAVLPGSTSASPTDDADRSSYAVKSIVSSFDSTLGQAIRAMGQMDYAILRLSDPLLRSLTIVYEQPLASRVGHLDSLRLVLVRFVAAALPFLAVNAAFRAHFRNEWERPLRLSPFDERPKGRTVIDDLIVDYAMFSDLGRIGRQKAEPSRAGPIHTREPSRFSLARTFALLQKISKNERFWTTGKGTESSIKEDSEDDSDSCTIVPVPDSKDDAGDRGGNEEEATVVQSDSRKTMEANLSDHGNIMAELLKGLEGLLTDEMSKRGRRNTK